MMRLAGASSPALGTLLSGLTIATIISTNPRNYLRRLPRSSSTILPALTVSIVLAFHSIISSRTADFSFDTSRCIESELLLSILLCCGILFYRLVLSSTPRCVLQSIRIAYAVFVAMGLFGVLAIRLNGGASKAVLFFLEPAHFALAFMYLNAPMLFVTRGWSRASVSVISVLLAVGLQNLTLLVASLLTLVVISRRGTVAVLIAIVTLTAATGTTDYFTSRLELSSSSNNLSALVWLQGWENASDILNRTSAIGIGFQQLGLDPARGDAADKIYELFGDSLNEKDGGSLAAKVVSELGALGILAILFYLIACSKTLSILSVISRGDVHDADIHRIFSASIILMLSIELFVRGPGYFSPGLLLGAGPMLMGTKPSLSVVASAEGTEQPALEAVTRDAQHISPTKT